MLCADIVEHMLRPPATTRPLVFQPAASKVTDAPNAVDGCLGTLAKAGSVDYDNPLSCCIGSSTGSVQ